MNETTVFLRALCCVALLFIVTDCDEIQLTCSDVAKRKKTDISGLFRFGSSYAPSAKEASSHVVFLQIYKTIWTFAVHDENPDKTLPRCLGISSIHRFTQGFIRDEVHQEHTEAKFYFNSSMAIGIMEATEDVWKRGGQCNISILDEVLAIGIFKVQWHVLNNIWDFSSPLLGVHYRWLQGFYYKEEQEIPLPFTDLTRLQNTSIEWIHIINFRSVPEISLMPLLRSITIEECRLIFFDIDSFIGMPEVETVTIRRSAIQVMPISIGHLTNLKSLEISYSTYTSGPFLMKSSRLANLQNLETLNLGRDNIYSKLGELPPIKSLKKLLLFQCQIPEIKDSVFSGAPALEVLDLSGNFIHTLNPMAFSNLQNLQVLDLSNNDLTNWPVLYNNSLKLLDLSKNSLTYLNNLGEYGTTTEYLNISKNEISSWNDTYIFSIKNHAIGNFMKNVYSPHIINESSINKDSKSINWSVNEFNDAIPTIDVAWVKKLNLSNNQIIGFSKPMIESLEEVNELDLGGNKFNCEDCGMIYLQKWLNLSLTNVTNLGTSDPLLCSSPSAYAGYPLVTVQVDETLCSKEVSKVWPYIVIQVSIVILLIFIASGLVYRFRAQISYTMHLYKIRKRARNFSDVVYNKYAFDAFVCYSSHDRQFAFNKLARTLEKDPANYELCLHERDFPLGSHIVSNIVGSIQHSRKTIIVLSENFIQSKWCKWEMEMAHHKMFQDDQEFLILILLDNLPRGKLPLHLQFLLSSRTYLEWPSSGGRDEEKAFQRLKDALGPSIFQKTNEPPPKLNDILDDY